MKTIQQWGEEFTRLSGATVEHDVQGELSYLYRTTQAQESTISQLEFSIAYQNQFIERLEAKLKKQAELITKYQQCVGAVELNLSPANVPWCLDYLMKFGEDMNKVK